MKPAPFTHHLPGTVDEAGGAARRACRRGRADSGGRAEPGADDGVPARASRASGRHKRHFRTRQDRGKCRLDVDRRARQALRLPPPGRGRAARRASGRHGPPYRALPDPHAGDVLRQPRACRPGIGMVPRRGDAGRKARRAERARRAGDRGGRFLRMGDDDRARRGRAAGPRRAPPAPRRTRAGGFASSPAAPATSRWRWRSSSTGSRTGRSVEPRVGLGGVEARPRRIPEGEAVLAGRAPARTCSARPAAAVSEAVDAMADSHASAGYRSEIAAVMVERALADAAR